MKSILLMALLMTSQAFAMSVCDYSDTAEFRNALEASEITPVRVAKNHRKFTSVEKQLIHKTVTLQSWLQNISAKESLETFGDYSQGRRGVNAGEIAYYNVDGKQLILVHYWPGENEYGAFYRLNKNGSFKLLAEVTDGYIFCK